MNDVVNYFISNDQMRPGVKYMKLPWADLGPDDSGSLGINWKSHWEEMMSGKSDQETTGHARRLNISVLLESILHGDPKRPTLTSSEV